MKWSYEKVDEYLVLSLCAIAASVIFLGAGLVRWRQATSCAAQVDRLAAIHEQVRKDAGTLAAQRDPGMRAPSNEDQFNTLLEDACVASGIDPGQLGDTLPTREELPDKPYDLVEYTVSLGGVTMSQLADLFYNLKLKLPGARVRNIRVTRDFKHPDTRRANLTIAFAVAS